MGGGAGKLDGTRSVLNLGLSLLSLDSSGLLKFLIMIFFVTKYPKIVVKIIKIMEIGTANF